MKLAAYLSQKQLDKAAFAKALGVSTMGVHQWIRGIRTPRPQQMMKIVRATGGAVQPNDFLPSDVEAAE